MRRKRWTVLAVFAMVVALLPLSAVPAAAKQISRCNAHETPIYEIQGDGWSSPLKGETVWTEGVVTADFQKSSELSGFFIQDRYGDGDPATSDGVFVDQGDTWGFDVKVGDYVRLKADVEEHYGLTQLGYVKNLEFCGKGKVKRTKVELPLTASQREALEGMLVRFEKKLFVTDTYNLHKYGEVWLSQDGVAEQPTNEFGGGTPEMDALAASNMDKSILLASVSTDPVPYTHHNGTLRLGDFTRHLDAVISYGFGQYRLMPTDKVVFKPLNHRPNPPHPKGTVAVGSANVLNYWTTLGGRGASTAAQLAVQTEKLVAELTALGADVIGLEEIENDRFHTPITTLVAAMNAAEGEDVWKWAGEPVKDDGSVYYNSYPIRNEIIYRSDRVTPLFEHPMTIKDDVFDYIPGGRSDPVGRPPVAQAFEANGEVFTVVVNHLKSKGCGGASGADEDQGDGQSCYNARRVLQAQRVLQFVDDLRQLTGDDDVLVVGDMNSYLEEDPIVEFESELVNLVSEYDENPYSYNFFATFAFPYVGRGLLDHAFATDSMAGQVRSTDVWHINADEPRMLDWYDPSNVAPGPYRASDHDPVVIGIRLSS